jgi:hypothetical protein
MSPSSTRRYNGPVSFNQGVSGSRPVRPTLKNNESVNDFVNKIDSTSINVKTSELYTLL